LATRITGLPSTRPITNGGILTQEARSYFRVITERALIIGEGSPEGVVEAEKGATYMDELGATGSILYIKKQDEISGDRASGWVLV